MVFGLVVLLVQPQVLDVIGLEVRNQDEVVVRLHNDQKTELRRFPISKDIRLFWFEPNPRQPIVAYIRTDSLISVDSFAGNQESWRFQPEGASRIGGLRWQSNNLMLASSLDERCDILRWDPLKEVAPTKVGQASDHWGTAEALRGYSADRYIGLVPKDSITEEWDLHIQGLFPFITRCLACPVANFSVRMKLDRFDFFRKGMTTWQTIKSLPGQRISIIRESGDEHVAVTVVESPNKSLWARAGGNRQELTDAEAKNTEAREKYTTYFVDSSGKVIRTVNLAYAVEVRW